MMRAIDGVPHLRPCALIKSEGTEKNDWAAEPIAQQYEVLTTMLPLAGGEVMTPVKPGGEPLLAAKLRDETPWMAAAIDRIAEQLAMHLWAGRPWVRFRPLLLVGAPGGGKSHLARRLGELAGTGSALLSFAGVHNNAELAGNPRGYRHLQPSFPALAMQRTRTANPVCVIDEVEKAGAGGNGDPVATLLSMLEPSTARRFYDGCLASEIDLSAVNWVLTANSTARLPAPLLSRVDVVEVDGPGPEHAPAVLATLWRSFAADAELPPAALPTLEPEAEAMLLTLFRRTRSVRRLRRALEALVAASVGHAPRLLN